jgi:hypothetical protein
MRKRTKVLFLIFLGLILIIPSTIFIFLIPLELKANITLINSINIDGGFNNYDAVFGITQDEDGYIYATGFITIPGGPVIPENGSDIWLAKFDSNLNMLVNKTINGNAYQDDWGYVPVCDGNGYLYVVGYLNELGEGNNIFLGKFYCSNLSMIDYITINGPSNGTDEGYGLLYNQLDGNLYVTGTITNSTQGYDIYIGKFDTDLNLIKSVTLDGPSSRTDKGRFFTLDNSGNLYISGSKSQVGTNYDMWLGKFNTDLILQNEIIIAGPTAGEDKGYGICYSKGIIYITGVLTGIGTGYDIFLAKYDTDLNQIKNITLNGPVDGEDVAYSFFLYKNKIYQTGGYSEALGGSNALIACYNTNLELQFLTTFDGSAHSYDMGGGIIKGLEDNFYVSGFLNESSEDCNIWIAQFALS